MIVDTGLLVALERGDRDAWAMIRAAEERGQLLIAAAGVLAQAWRGRSRQARLAVALRAVDVDPMGRAVARDVGTLLGRFGGDDVVDGHVALLAQRRPALPVATGDRTDLVRLGVPDDRIIDV